VLDEPLVDPPARGRVYPGGRRVRLSDVDPSGRLRLDAVARYLQDVAGDDAAESGIEAGTITWVVRRTVIDVVAPFRFREWVDLATWCSGTGGRWAARRTSLVGDRGGRADAEALWICVDLKTQAPARLPASFGATYGESAAGRRVSSRLWLDGPPPDASRVAWPLRASDHDVLDHVNNAAYWEAVEERLVGRSELLAQPFRAVLEYGPGLEPGDTVELAVVDRPDTVALWFLVRGKPQASAMMRGTSSASAMPASQKT
jgi:acyl-ACP thioesterase